ncbi:putative uridine kinase [Glycine max]|nr:putative uridine kinase [Glycine max]
MEATFSSTTARGYWNQTRGSTEPLLLRVDEARDRKPSSLSIARPSKFVQLSLARTRKSSFFKVLSAEKEQIHVVEGSRVDELYDALVTRILPLVSVSSNPNHKLLVGLAGPPGAGKSTLAHEVARRINKLWPEKASSFDSQVQLPDVAIVVPMDGFHLYRSELDEMESDKLEQSIKLNVLESTVESRGSTCQKGSSLDIQSIATTSMSQESENASGMHRKNSKHLCTDMMEFLSALFCCILVKQILQGSVYVPSFDHGVGDPVEDDIFVNLQFLCFLPLCRHKVVIVEGNYLLLEDGVWKEISSLFDEKWQVLILSRHMFIDIDIDKAMQRVLKRHISTGKPPDIAKQRIENNDRLNAELIMKSKKNADIIIKSIDF